jgi:hypothetical protein
MITLKQIEETLKPNFIFDKDGDMQYETGIHQHRLKTSFKAEGSRTAALIVFIGAAYFNGYKKADIIHYLEINKTQFDGLFARFIAAYNQYSFCEISHLYSEQTTEKRLIAKYRLICNALKLQQPKELFVSLADLPH